MAIGRALLAEHAPDELIAVSTMNLGKDRTAGLHWRARQPAQLPPTPWTAHVD